MSLRLPLLRLLLVLVCVGARLATSSASQEQGSSEQEPAETIQGLAEWWRSDGYGYALRWTPQELELFESSDRHCLPAAQFRRASNESESSWLYQEIDDPSYVLRLKYAPDTKRLSIYEAGTVAGVACLPLEGAPETYEQEPATDAETCFELFWSTFRDHYPFFELRGIDWEARYREVRPRIRADTSARALFQHMEQLLEPLEDAHTFIYAESLGFGFSGERPDPLPRSSAQFRQAREILKQRYLQAKAQSACRGKLLYGWLASDIAYLNVRSFEGFADDDSFAAEAKELERALDRIFGAIREARALVIDVRFNPGGYDPHGLAIASRLTEQAYFAYAKQARNDPEDPDRFTPLHEVRVESDPDRPRFLGPVVLLTSRYTVSAGETFTMALMQRQPAVRRIGGATQGVFSDVLLRQLPNGWEFGLPNEVYRDDAGRHYEAHGVPPHESVPVFSDEDLEKRRDASIERALEWLEQR